MQRLLPFLIFVLVISCADRPKNIDSQAKESLNKLIPPMVRQAHHERNQPLNVRPEPVLIEVERLVERLNQGFPNLQKGKNIAFSRDKGNCLACHVIADGEFPGNIGPELKSLPTRFQSKQQLREQIWDATRFNPQTSMPPFGKNKILTDREIDLVVDYLWSLK